MFRYPEPPTFNRHQFAEKPRHVCKHGTVLSYHFELSVYSILTLGFFLLTSIFLFRLLQVCSLQSGIGEMVRLSGRKFQENQSDDIPSNTYIYLIRYKRLVHYHSINISYGFFSASFNSIASFFAVGKFIWATTMTFPMSTNNALLLIHVLRER